MIKESYKITDKHFSIINEIDKFDERILNWTMQLEKEPFNNNSLKTNYLKICKDSCIISLNGKKKIIKKPVEETDLYYIYYNFISKIVGTKSQTLIHSAAVKIDGKALLFIGDFASGKTSIISEFNNSDIISADQSIIKLIEDKLYLIWGSNYCRKRDRKDTFLKLTNEAIQIDKIFILKSVCKNGDMTLTKADRKEKVRELYKNISWHYSTPLFTDNKLLLSNKKNDIIIANKINADCYMVSGDPKKIVNKIKECLND